MKRHLGDLAVFGGRPAFLYPLRVGRPNRIDRQRFFDRLNWSIDNQWLTNGGPLTREFEERIADLAGVRHCIATCNATSGLQLCARAAGLTGEVLMPSFTFVATAHAMRWLGLDPVFCDVDPETGCIDPRAAEAAMSERTAAIVGVHLWGRPCAVDDLAKLAATRDAYLFFDAAQALGVTSAGRPVGGFGAAEVFSFHATKVVNAFEGGGVVTDNDELAAQIRALQNFGIDADSPSPWGGTNAKLSEASAAMGLTSLEAFEESITHNETNYEMYRSELEGVPGVRVLPFDRQERTNFQYVAVTTNPNVNHIGRDLMLAVLRAELVEAKPYFSPPCHQLEPYRSHGSVELPVTEELSTQALVLPTGTTVAREDIRRICDVLALAATQGAQLTASHHHDA